MELVELNGTTPPPVRRLAELLFRGSSDGHGPRLDRVRDQVDRLEARIRGLTAPEDRAGHVFFAPTAGGYTLRDGEGACPAPGDRFGDLVVVRLGASPLPGDRRVCVFLASDPSGSGE